MSLHPAFREYLDQLNPLVVKAAAEGVQPTPDSARAALASLNQFALPAVAVAEVRESALGGIPVRIYIPEPEEACDVVFFVHGGGHMAGDLDVYDFSARRLAGSSGMVVVSVDYARSPEAPYPIGLEQTYAALQELSHGLPGVRVTGKIHGFADSGGAAKLASIAQRVARGEWSSPIDRQVLLYPSLDYTMSGETMDTYGQDYFLSTERVQWYFDNYFNEGDDRAQASPGLGPFNAAMPDTLVIAAEYDPLFSEAVSYVEAMRAAGSSAHLIVATGMIHAFAFFEAMVADDVDRLYEVSADFLADGEVPKQW